MSSNKNWELKIDGGVYKQLIKIPQKYRGKIVWVIESLAHDPLAGDIQKIKGEEHVWRRRVGSYRIFYEISKQEKLIHVFWVERRTTKTY